MSLTCLFHLRFMQPTKGRWIILQKQLIHIVVHMSVVWFTCSSFTFKLECGFTNSGLNIMHGCKFKVSYLWLGASFQFTSRRHFCRAWFMNRVWCHVIGTSSVGRPKNMLFQRTEKKSNPQNFVSIEHETITNLPKLDHSIHIMQTFLTDKGLLIVVFKTVLVSRLIMASRWEF